MSNPLEKIKKNSTIKETSIISKSSVYGKKDMTKTEVPMINVALSASMDGGISPGLTMIAGPSKHFKSMFALLIASAYLKQHDDAVLLFYDNEFGTPEGYFDTFNIDMERVVHTPITDIEELKHDLVTQLHLLEKKDKVFIIIDSVGNLASKKETDDALSGSDKADMTRAKQFKSLWRMVTPYLATKDIPLIAVNHTYKTIEMYSKDQVSGGTGGIYSSNTIWIVGRQQEKKPGKELLGYNFMIKVEKSRFVREGAKIPITVLFDKGIVKWSGMFELAKEAGYIVSPSRGWYNGVNPETGEVLTENKREADIVDSDEFWNMMIEKTNIKAFIKDVYSIGGGKFDLFNDDDGEEIVVTGDNDE